MGGGAIKGRSYPEMADTEGKDVNNVLQEVPMKTISPLARRHIALYESPDPRRLFGFRRLVC